MEAFQPMVNVLTKDSFNVKIEDVIYEAYKEKNDVHNVKLHLTFSNETDVEDDDSYLQTGDE